MPCWPTWVHLDNAGFNLTKRCKRGHNILGHRAVTQVPGQRGCKTTICTAISNRGVLAKLGPYNTAQLLQFPNQLLDNIPQQEGEPGQPEQVQYVVIWDNVSFHCAALVQCPPHVHCSFFACIFPISESIEEIILSTAVESIWPQSLQTPKPPGSNAGRLWRCVCGVYPGLYKVHKGTFPLLPRKSKHNVWCWWDIMTWPRHEMRWWWDRWCSYCCWVTCTCAAFGNKSIILRMDSSLHVLSVWHFKGQLFVQNSMYSFASSNYLSP